MLLPSFPLTSDGKYYPSDLPERLNDNIESSYATLFTWDFFLKNFDLIIQEAFDNRVNNRNCIDNSRVQMKDNLNE